MKRIGENARRRGIMAQLPQANRCALLRGSTSWASVMLMAEISEPSEPPEAPESVKWVRWLWHHFTQEGEVIRKAPLAFVVTISAGGLLFFAIVQSRFSGE